MLGFLMHRVELKAAWCAGLSLFDAEVPNAPCGVESALRFSLFRTALYMFLMHRVELKETIFAGTFQRGLYGS